MFVLEKCVMVMVYVIELLNLFIKILFVNVILDGLV